MRDVPASKASICLHLYLSPVQHATRLYKEAAAVLELGLFDQVHVLGKLADGFAREEAHGSGLIVHRLELWNSRCVGKRGRFALLFRKLATVASYLQYGFAAINLARRLRPSHLCSHNPETLPSAFLASLFCGANVVYAPHELEAERTGLTGFYKRLSVAIEHWFIRRCSAVVVVCEPIAEWYRARYGLEKVHVVRAIPEARAVQARDPAARDSIRQTHGVPPNGLLFIYQGLLEPARGVDLLLKTFLGLEEPFHLMLMGFGGSEARIREAAAACPRIHFQPAVPIDQIVRYSAAADVGVFTLANPVTRSYALSLPNKFFEYVSAGLPVLVSANLELQSKMVREHGIGWVAAPERLREAIASIGRNAVAGQMPAVARFAVANTWERERLVYREVYGRRAPLISEFATGDGA